MLAFTKNDAMPRPTPYCFLNASLRRSRSAMTAVMSTSLNVVSIAAVLLRLDQTPGDRLAPLGHAHALFGAVAGCRRCDRLGAVGAASLLAGRCELVTRVGATRWLACVGGAMALWTSCFITRPPVPEP